MATKLTSIPLVARNVSVADLSPLTSDPLDVAIPPTKCSNAQPGTT